MSSRARRRIAYAHQMAQQERLNNGLRNQLLGFEVRFENLQREYEDYRSQHENLARRGSNEGAQPTPPLTSSASRQPVGFKAVASSSEQRVSISDVNRAKSLAEHRCR